MYMVHTAYEPYLAYFLKGLCVSFFTSREDNARKCLTLLIKENMKRVEVMSQAIYLSPVGLHLMSHSQLDIVLCCHQNYGAVYLMLSSDILSNMVDQKSFLGHFIIFFFFFFFFRSTQGGGIQFTD